jgi:hypothetical protein
MTGRTYIAALSSIGASIALMPWVEDALKVVMIVMFVIITLTVNVAFRIPKVWNSIVDRVAADVLHRVLMDKEIGKVIVMMHRRQLGRIKKEQMKKAGNKGQAQ